MMLIHMEYMVGRRQEHFLSLRQDHGLEHIYDLCNTGHLDPVAVLVENIQGNSCRQGIPHGILLVQEARIRARLHIMPASPFIHHHPDFLFRVICIHNGAVACKDFFYIKSPCKSIKPDCLVEVCGASLMDSFFHPGVIVDGQAIHKAVCFRGSGISEAFPQHHIRPFIVIRIGSAADFEYGGILVIAADIGLISAVKVGVIIRGHIAAAAPVFVAHAEIIHLPGLFPAVFTAPVRHGGNAVQGHVFHPFAHFLHRAASHISIHIGLAAQLLAQLEKLMRTEAVVLRHASPVGVDHFLSLIFGPHAVLPMVFIRKTASRPAQYRNL